MAKQTLAQIKNWFRTRLKPTQAQYWDTWDSFWHKDDVLPQVQSDWNQATETEKDFIKNKPTLGSMASKNFWTGTQAAYDLIDPKDANAIYHVEEE